MRTAIHGALLAACLAASTSHAQALAPTQEWQARSYVKSAFITGAAVAILNEDVAVGQRLRTRLSLPADADREQVYEALFALTEEKQFTVRSATFDEARDFTSRSDQRPVIALDTDAVTVLMQYDLQQNNVVRVALPPAPAPSAVAGASPKLAALTTAPAPVMPREPVVLRLTPVSFDFDKAELKGEAQAQLERDGLPKLIDLASAQYIVAGYADRLGAAEYNRRLSERRAQAVRDYLVMKGVPAASIRLLAFGSARPVTDCSQKNRRALIACLAPDRRVTVEIQPSPL